ncbi:MAG: hypothetical protein JNM50_04015 [Chromatiales bacterium]|nr:hypothetical protein [Chromatiales bacterium]
MLHAELRQGLVELIGLPLVERIEAEYAQLCETHGFDPTDTGAFLAHVYFRSRARFGPRGWQVDEAVRLH